MEYILLSDDTYQASAWVSPHGMLGFQKLPEQDGLGHDHRKSLVSFRPGPLGNSHLPKSLPEARGTLSLHPIPDLSVSEHAEFLDE